MTCRIGINGFGRIGRMVLRRSVELPDIEVVAINDLADLGDLTYLLKYDSVHGPFPGQVSNDEQTLRVNGQAVQFSSERDAAKIPWGQAGVDVVIESTGALRGRSDASGHLQGGVRKVLISAPSDDVDVTIVPGVNEAMYDPRSIRCSPWPRARPIPWRPWPRCSRTSSASCSSSSPPCMRIPPASRSWTSPRASGGGVALGRCR